MPLTKHNYMVRDINDLADTIREAFLIAKSGRPGPVLVDIPKSIQNSFHEFENKPIQAPKECPLPSDEELNAAAALINESEKPFIYVGGGVVISGAQMELIELAEKIDSPLGSSMMGLTAVPWYHRNFTGMLGMHGDYTSTWAITHTDLVIALGTRFSDRVTGDKEEFAKNAKILHIDIDEAEICKNIRVHMSLVGDVKAILCALLKKVKMTKHDIWSKEVSEIKKTRSLVPIEDDEKIRPWNVILKAWEKVGDDAVIATDVGQHQMWTSQYYRFSKMRTYLTSGGLGTMGFGMGAAIGGHVATGKRTILFTGDGSFHMNLNELATMVTYRLPIVIVVFNNASLGMVRQWQEIFFEKRFSCTELDRKTDYVKLADAFGGKGFKLTDPGELDRVFDEAFKVTDKPVVIDCLIDPFELVLPMIPAGGSIKNIITERAEDDG
jgi:acetolactate synthase-1/2/3 large subunit